MVGSSGSDEKMVEAYHLVETDGGVDLII